MIKFFLFMHIMIADPNNTIPKVYDFWFEDHELRYFATEKDCKTKGNEIMKCLFGKCAERSEEPNALWCSTHSWQGYAPRPLPHGFI